MSFNPYRAHDLTFYRDPNTWPTSKAPLQVVSRPEPMTLQPHLRHEPVHPCLDEMTVQSAKMTCTGRVGDSLASFLLLGHDDAMVARFLLLTTPILLSSKRAVQSFRPVAKRHAT